MRLRLLPLPSAAAASRLPPTAQRWTAPSASWRYLKMEVEKIPEYRPCCSPEAVRDVLGEQMSQVSGAIKQHSWPGLPNPIRGSSRRTGNSLWAVHLIGRRGSAPSRDLTLGPSTGPTTRSRSDGARPEILKTVDATAATLRLLPLTASHAGRTHTHLRGVTQSCPELQYRTRTSRQGERSRVTPLRENARYRRLVPVPPTVEVPVPP